MPLFLALSLSPILSIQVPQLKRLPPLTKPVARSTLMFTLNPEEDWEELQIPLMVQFSTAIKPCLNPQTLLWSCGTQQNWSRAFKKISQTHSYLHLSCSYLSWVQRFALWRKFPVGGAVEPLGSRHTGAVPSDRHRDKVMHYTLWMAVWLFCSTCVRWTYHFSRSAGFTVVIGIHACNRAAEDVLTLRNIVGIVLNKTGRWGLDRFMMINNWRLKSRGRTLQSRDSFKNVNTDSFNKDWKHWKHSKAGRSDETVWKPWEKTLHNGCSINEFN